MFWKEMIFSFVYVWAFIFCGYVLPLDSFGIFFGYMCSGVIGFFCGLKYIGVDLC